VRVLERSVIRAVGGRKSFAFAFDSSRTPTPSGQSAVAMSLLILAAGRRSPACRRSAAKRQQTVECGVSARPRIDIQDCCAAHRLQARLVRPPGRSAVAMSLLILAAGRRSPACRRSAAKRQQTVECGVSARPRIDIQDYCAAHRLQARLLRPPGRARSQCHF